MIQVMFKYAPRIFQSCLKSSSSMFQESLKYASLGCPKICQMKKINQIFFASGLSHSLGPWDSPKENSNQSDFL